MRPTSARDQAIRKLLIALCLLLLSWQTATAQAPLEQALKHHRLRLRQLETALQKAQSQYQAGLEAAQLELRDQFEQAIEQAAESKHRKLARRLRLQMEAQLKGQIPYVPELNGRPVFESVLGIYGQGVRGPRYPLINLKPPCAAELWSEEVQAAGRRCTSAGNPRLTFSTAEDAVASADFRSRASAESPRTWRTGSAGTAQANAAEVTQRDE